MTLPALGVIGLTFLCILLVGGLAFLILFVNPNLRYRLCEVLSSYRSPPSEEKIQKQMRKKRKKSEQKSGGGRFEDMYNVGGDSSPTSEPIELREQVHSMPHGGMHETYNNNMYPHSNAPNRHGHVDQHQYPQHHPSHHQQQHHHMPSQSHYHQHSQGTVQHPYHNRKPPKSHQPTKKRSGSGEYLMYPNSSGTASPTDSAIGTMEATGGKSIHGILKHTTGNNGKNDSKGSNRHSKNTKSVAYEDQIHTIEMPS